MKPTIDYRLYLVTDQELLHSTTLEKAVEQAIQGGCTLIQLREKKRSALEFYNTALRIKTVTDSYQVPLIINDRADIAAAVDAAGVHIGQNDLPVAAARKIIGPEKILGVSAATLDEAVCAQKDGADYLGVGAMFPTGTKSDAKFVSLDQLKQIRKAVSIPIVVIGGIGPKTILQFRGLGIDGFSAVSAIMSARDVFLAAKQLRERINLIAEEKE